VSGACTPEQAALAVVAVLGTRPDPAAALRVMAPQRGSPHTARMRAVTMLVWRTKQPEWPNLTETGRAFGRDRRNVARALVRLREHPPRAEDLNRIYAHLGSMKGAAQA
jgi:hypothetical protein